jgi:hypothetical protein
MVLLAAFVVRALSSPTLGHSEVRGYEWPVFLSTKNVVPEVGSVHTMPFSSSSSRSWGENEIKVKNAETLVSLTGCTRNCSALSRLAIMGCTWDGALAPEGVDIEAGDPDLSLDGSSLAIIFRFFCRVDLSSLLARNL